MNNQYLLLLIPLVLVMFASVPNVYAANPSVTSIVRTGGGAGYPGGTITLNTDSFSSSMETIIIGCVSCGSPLSDDPDNTSYSAEQEYTVTIDTQGQEPTVVAAGADLERWSYDSGTHILTIVTKSTKLSFSGIPGNGFGLALNVSYGGFAGFDGVYVTTNAQSISCSVATPLLNCNVSGTMIPGVTPFADIYIPGNTIPPGDVKVTFNGATEVQGGTSQTADATVTNPAPSDRQVTKTGLTTGLLVHLVFHFSSNTISISNGGSSVSVPEFPFQFGLLIMFVIGAVLYLMIRSRYTQLKGFRTS